MIREHGTATFRSQERKRLGDRIVENLKFLIHFDTNRLEAPAGRMSALAADGGRYRVANDVGQFGRGGNGSSRDDAASDTASVGLITIPTQERYQRPFIETIHKIVGRRGGTAVHPHIERPVVAKAEPAIGEVELR